MKRCVTHSFACDCREMKFNELTENLIDAEIALLLIAQPKRQDGTHNRCREACEQLANAYFEKREKK